MEKLLIGILMFYDVYNDIISDKKLTNNLRRVNSNMIKMKSNLKIADRHVLTEKEKFFLIDTHLTRVLTRLGFSTKYISSIESKLTSDLGISRVTHFSNLISNFGKYLCLSRKPKCSECNLVRICQFRFIER